MKYDPIMCMMVDDSVKTKDGIGDIINYKGYKLERVTPKDVVIYKNGKRIDLAFKYPKSFKEAKERIDKGEFDSDKKTIDKAITTCDKTEFDPQDIRYIRKAIGNLKIANSLLGMINEGTVNKAKQNIANTISLLESID